MTWLAISRTGLIHKFPHLALYTSVRGKAAVLLTKRREVIFMQRYYTDMMFQERNLLAISIGENLCAKGPGHAWLLCIPSVNARARHGDHIGMGGSSRI